MNHNNLSISINHVFHAPPAKVYSLFSNADNFKKWWRLAGLSIEEVEQFDFTPNGTSQYGLLSNDHVETFAMLSYDEISTPRKLVFSSFFCDKNGNSIPSPLQANWPLEIRYEFLFVEDFDSTSLEVKVSTPGADFEPVRDELLAELRQAFHRIEVCLLS